MLKVKADISMKKAGSTSETSQKEEEVVMDTNQAYEMAEMHIISISGSLKKSTASRTSRAEQPWQRRTCLQTWQPISREVSR